MHKHNHECGVCKHECLHYCSCCDKVYCCKCDKEWGGYSYYYPTYPNTWPNPYFEPMITWGSGAVTCDSGDSATDCTHVH